MIVGDLEIELAALREQLRQAKVATEEEIEAHAQTRSSLQDETISRHTAQQKVADLQERLAENEAHRRSLEEKHAHARDSLEHYRQSVKEQRDQDQRRHEQQLSAVTETAIGVEVEDRATVNGIIRYISRD